MLKLLATLVGTLIFGHNSFLLPLLMLFMYHDLSEAISLKHLYSKVDLTFPCSFSKLVFVLKSKQEKMQIILEKEKLTQKLVRRQ